MTDVLEAALLAVTSSLLAVDLMPVDDAIARGEESVRSQTRVAPQANARGCRSMPRGALATG